MILTKNFSLFGLSFSCSKNIFILKCGCFSGSNLVYIASSIFRKIYSMRNFKKLCPLGLSIVALYVALKTKTTEFFSDSFSRYHSENLIQTLKIFLLVTTFQNTEIKKKKESIYVNQKWCHDEMNIIFVCIVSLLYFSSISTQIFLNASKM